MNLEVTPNVVYHATQLGIDAMPEAASDMPSDCVKSQILDMVHKSAPVTHPFGNKRFEEWVFQVSDNRVTRIHFIICESCEDKKRIQVYDVCPSCDGEGCKWCRESGERENMIPCPECT